MRLPDEMSEAEQFSHVKIIVRRGWDDHMWNFEHMAEADESWLRLWAGIGNQRDVENVRTEWGLASAEN